MAHKGRENHRGGPLEAAVPPALIGLCDNEAAPMKKPQTVLAIYCICIFF